MAKKPSSNLEGELVGIIDALIREQKRQDAWILALADSVAKIESEKTGKPIKEVKAAFLKKQRRFLQKLWERAEDRNPGTAAQLDDRSLEDLP